MKAYEARELMPSPIDNIETIERIIKQRAEAGYNFTYEQLTGKIIETLKFNDFKLIQVYLPEKDMTGTLYKIIW